MNPKCTRIFQVLICALCAMVSTIALTQENVSSTGRVSPRLAVMPPRPAPANFRLPSGALPEWNGFFVYNGTQLQKIRTRREGIYCSNKQPFFERDRGFGSDTQRSLL
jgi:hypothetical protein